MSEPDVTPTREEQTESPKKPAPTKIQVKPPKDKVTPFKKGTKLLPVKPL
jgi:hypothetical protein